MNAAAAMVEIRRAALALDELERRVEPSAETVELLKAGAAVAHHVIAEMGLADAPRNLLRAGLFFVLSRSLMEVTGFVDQVEFELRAEAPRQQPVGAVGVTH